MPASKSRSSASKGTKKGAGAGSAKARIGGGRGRAGGAMASLGDVDRRYIEQSLSDAKTSGAAGGGEHDVLDVLERFGLSSARVQQLRGALSKVDVRESVDKASDYLSEQIKSARDYTRENKGKVIGGAAGVLVGASLLAYALKRASDEKKRKSSSSKKSSGGSKKSAASKKSSGGSKKSRSRK
jgi:hypothetical protein